MGFVLRWIVTAVATAAAVWIVPGITTVGSDSTVSVAVFALVLSLVNVAIKPVAQLLGAPLSILTLGIFYIVINALMLELAAWASSGLFAGGIAIDGFGSAFIGAIVISIVSSIVNNIVGKDQ